MVHRGPDDSGEWYSPDLRVGLAHRRLSILDLSAAGHQPMVDDSGKFCIVYNGELYNHNELRDVLRSHGVQFRSSSDTEVLLEAWKAWGPACLSMLNGMFAFSIYDQARHKLFLARDRVGEKPLFYYHKDGRILFSSELKGLIASRVFSPELDRISFQYYLAYGYVPGHQCILKDCRKLQAAHYLCFDLDANAVKITPYWELPNPEGGVHSMTDLTQDLLSLLDDAVGRQLIADVPVGVLLSGGVDSSIVTASAAKRSSRPVKTFTITFPGHGRYDEGPQARIVAKRFGTEHKELPAESASVELLPKLARQFDEPIADSSVVPTYLISKLVREHVTVALGGDGGDELFGGYPHYCWVQTMDKWRRALPHWSRCLISSMAGMLPIGFRGRNHFLSFSGDVSTSLAHVNLYFDATTRCQLLRPLLKEGAECTAPEESKKAIADPCHSICRRATETDFKTMLVDDFLVKVDRASMLNSLEVRSPFLDYRIVEFAFSKVPDKLKATENERKILLRHAGEKILPSSLEMNRKQGLSIPLSSWFKGPWGLFMEEILRGSGGLYDQAVVRSLIRNQCRGYANTQRLFALTIFELWRKEYHVSI